MPYLSARWFSRLTDLPAWFRAHTTILLAVQSLLVASIIVAVSFPDVVFLGRSIGMLDSFVSMSTRPPPLPLYPEEPHRAGHHGFTDVGGAVWQSEPMIHFMRHAITAGESPYWNPYSATGALGPETLVDQKFSPLTLLVAFGGGSLVAFHIVILSLYVFALAFVYATLRRFLSLSFLASATGALVYLLNGFHIANLNSNVVQVYLYLPACLYTLLLFAERPDIGRLIAVSAAHVAALLTTFMPTTVMGMIGIWGMALAYAVGRTQGYQIRERVVRVAGTTAMQTLGAVLALMALAPLYLPVVEALQQVGAVDSYSRRIFYPVSINNLIGAFTPKHVFESYNAIDPFVWNARSEAYIGNVAFHFGVPAMALAAAGLTARHSVPVVRAVALAAAALLVLAFGRLYGVPGVGPLVELLPLVRNIGAQYWWMLIGVLAPVAAALGVQAFVQGYAPRWAPFSIVLIILAAAAIVGFKYVPSPAIDYPYGYVVRCLGVLAGLLVFTTLLLGRVRAPPMVRVCAATSLVILMFLEFSFYMNHMRFDREERVLKPPPEIVFLRENLNGFRVANFGFAGVPPEWGSMYQVPQIGSLNNNVLPYYLSFFKRTMLADPAERWGDFPSLHLAKDRGDFNFDALDLVSARYLVIQASTHPNRLASLDVVRFPRRFESIAVSVVENPGALPRAYLVPALNQAVRTPGEQGLWARNVAFTEDAVLLGQARRVGVPEGGDGTRVVSIPDNAVRIVDSGHATVTLEVDWDRPAVLVMSDAWHPNWRAWANGVEVHVGRVNEAFRGVVVHAGKTVLQLSYAPRSLSAAIALAGAALLIVAISMLARRRINRRLSAICCGSPAS